ncbi:hypothetical protein EV359DRAFT_51891, partial [Lentinula novae-zelandiae]
IVIALYEKVGGKSGAHGYVDSSTNLCALSYIGVQHYLLWPGGLFRAAHPKFPMALMFAQITPQTFLTTLVETPAFLGGNLKLSSKDWETYQQLASNFPDVCAFLKSIAIKRSAQ